VVSRDRTVIPATRCCEDSRANKEKHCERGRGHDYVFEKIVSAHDRVALPPTHRLSPDSLARSVAGPCVTDLACR
jgi:hypothetical protein